MSTHGHDNQGHDQELVESSGIKAKPILIFLGALAVATALVFIIIKVMFFGFAKMDEINKPQSATQINTGPKLPPEPRLQGAPEPDPDKPGDIRRSLLPLDDMAAYRKQINEKVAEYEWVDKQGGIARIPIERAKELITEKGLPSLSPTAIAEIETAEKIRKEVYGSDSSAGRLIKPETTPKTAAVPSAAGETPAQASMTAAPAAESMKTASPAATPKPDKVAPKH